MQNREFIPGTLLSSLVDSFAVNFLKFRYGVQFLLAFGAFLSVELANVNGLFGVGCCSFIGSIYCGR